MDELAFVRDQLERHRGRANPISAGEIAEMLGYPVEGSHVKGRDLVKRCSEKYRIPVGGNTSGYYIITTEDELNEYKANLRSRADKTLERGVLMTEFFEERYK